MEEIVNYVQPELMILVPVLYLVGIGLKKTSLVSDRLIPVVLALCGIFMATIYVLASNNIDGWKAVLTAIFTAVTQGILVAGASVFCNQIYKQFAGNKSTNQTADKTEETTIDK